MKEKAIEKLAPKRTRKRGKAITVQTLDNILILNVWMNSVLQGRYCMNTESHEYKSCRKNNGEWTWRQVKLSEIGMHSCYRYSSSSNRKERLDGFSETDNKFVMELLDTGSTRYESNAYDLIGGLEREKNYDAYIKAARNKKQRIDALMELVPELPDDIDEWIFEKVTGVERFLKDSLTGKWRCSKCRSSFDENEWDIKPIRGQEAKCPVCGNIGRIEKRPSGALVFDKRFSIIQEMSDELVVMRHFDTRVEFKADYGKYVYKSEAARVVFPRDGRHTKHSGCDIYYNQYPLHGNAYYGKGYNTCTDFNTRNPANRRMGNEWIYPHGIKYLIGSTKETWANTLQIAAMKGTETDYNSLMAVRGKRLAQVTELILKGRFYKLFSEVAYGCYVWDGCYHGYLNIDGDSIEEVFGINDKQIINRLRDKNGDGSMLKWFRWCDETEKRMPDKVLDWLIKNRIDVDDPKILLDVMSPEAAMNYIVRQQKESYPGFSVNVVIGQYEDYMAMAKITGKDLSDEMVYKPRELKRRHDELVATKNQLEIVKGMMQDPEKRQREAEAMREKFPEAEAILREVKDKFEWADDEYIVKVPKDLVEIMIEGNALHHCAGSSDRYFDRIVQRETYICFLRKADTPDIPYYTVEVEPGGTIRQHRGYLDEEPDIEDIKPHLKEWQKEIKRRMTKADKELARLSKVKREENIELLKAQGNIRVLNGLAEDFMEVI